MDDAQTDARTVTLSDGTKWEYRPDREEMRRWIKLSPLPKTGEWLMFVPSPFLSKTGLLTAADHRAVADVLDPPAALASPRATGSPKATHRELSSEISALWTRIEARFWKGHEEGCAGRQDSEGEFDGCNCVNHDAERALEELAELAAERSTEHADAEDALGRLYNYNVNPDSDAAERDRLIVVRALRASPSLASATAREHHRKITDYGWAYDGKVTFTVNMDSIEDARKLAAALDIAVDAASPPVPESPSPEKQS